MSKTNIFLALIYWRKIYKFKSNEIKFNKKQYQPPVRFIFQKLITVIF